MDIGRLQLSLAHNLIPTSRALLIDDYIKKRIRLETEFTLQMEGSYVTSFPQVPKLPTFVPSTNFYAKLFNLPSIIASTTLQTNMKLSEPSSSPISPTLSIKKEESTSDSIEESDCVPKKVSKGSASKNYIALLCTGFARTILGANQTSEVWVKISQIALEKKKKFEGIDKSDDDLVEYVKDQIYRDFCGKKVKRCSKLRDFKVRNTEELSKILSIEADDSLLVKFKKECLRELFSFFFNSNLYSEWLNNGMINPVNRSFFIVNKDELLKKFLNPIYYKPRFVHEF